MISINMQTPNLLLLVSFFSFFIVFFLTGQSAVQATSRHLHEQRGGHIENQEHDPNKLFVFGDSYVDTGNTDMSKSGAWKYPYGISVPGRPTGRFSDGHVFTDFMAHFLGLDQSPVPYQFLEVGGDRLKNGMNFAFGGSGVFEALTEPNMTTQIKQLENLINNGSIYTKEDLNSSFVLVALSGNDYARYIKLGGSAVGLPLFVMRVVNQLTVNLRHIRDLGSKRVLVTALQPLGCLPRYAAESSYHQCNATENLMVNFHNFLLQQAVRKMNRESKDKTFYIIDLYDAFFSVLFPKDNNHGTPKFPEPLKPCCVGIRNEYSCGDVDENGNKLYTLCENPELAFFFDNVHPTNVGWLGVYNTLLSELQREIKKGSGSHIASV